MLSEVTVVMLSVGSLELSVVGSYKKRKHFYQQGDDIVKNSHMHSYSFTNSVIVWVKFSEFCSVGAHSICYGIQKTSVILNEPS